MRRRILLVEDNEGVARLVEELAGELGAECVRARGGSEALSRLGEGPWDLVLLDLVLSDLDGFQVAAALRAQPGGDRVPLLVMSGVYKRLPEAFVERVRPLFLPKPFLPQELRAQVLSLFQHTDEAQGVRRGRFGQTPPAAPPAALFARLCEERATGLLECALGEVRRRLWWQAGQVRFGQSNVRSESVGGLLVTGGQLTPALFEQAVAHARTHKGALHEALLALGLVDAARLQEALRAQTAEVACGALGMAGAEWTFQPADVERQPDARRPALALVVEAARRGLPPAEARERLARLGRVLVRRTPLLDRELFSLRAAWPREAVTPLAGAQPQPLSDVLPKVPEAELPLAWALVQAGLWKIAPVEDVAASQAAAGPAPVDEDAGRHFSPAEQEARRGIFAEQERAAGLDHYAFLGLPRSAGPEEVRRAYLELARRFHSDSYAGLELGAARAALAQLFARANEAMATLTDGARRAEYEIFLQRTAAGLPTDVGAILRAEELFQRAEVLLKGGKAAEALELLQEAVRLNHAEAEFHAYLGYALFRTRGPEAADEAKAHLQRALEQAPSLASGYLFLGLVARDMGQEAEALRLLDTALRHDPKNEQAAREARALRRRQEKGDGKGLLSKLFGR